MKLKRLSMMEQTVADMKKSVKQTKFGITWLNKMFNAEE